MGPNSVILQVSFKTGQWQCVTFDHNNPYLKAYIHHATSGPRQMSFSTYLTINNRYQQATHSCALLEQCMVLPFNMLQVLLINKHSILLQQAQYRYSRQLFTVTCDEITNQYNTRSRLQRHLMTLLKANMKLPSLSLLI